MNGPAWTLEGELPQDLVTLLCRLGISFRLSAWHRKTTPIISIAQDSRLFALCLLEIRSREMK